jgi:hypothetical protein
MKDKHKEVIKSIWSNIKTILTILLISTICIDYFIYDIGLTTFEIWVFILTIIALNIEIKYERTNL